MAKDVDKPLFCRPDLKTHLAALPVGPGVYLMKSRDGKVIYVGKALELRQRVRSYFSGTGDTRPAVEFLQKRIYEIETIVTQNEKEALLLENNLIKKYQPRYNVRLRDDKNFLALRLSIHEPVPRLSTVRRPLKDDAA